MRTQRLPQYLGFTTLLWATVMTGRCGMGQRICCFTTRSGRVLSTGTHVGVAQHELQAVRLVLSRGMRSSACGKLAVPCGQRRAHLLQLAVQLVSSPPLPAR